MQGHVLKFDEEINKGIISGNDGNRYYFVRMNWVSDTEPKEGQNVDFDPEDKYAKDIITLKSKPKRKSKSIAVLLALLLGGIGVHKFYLGDAGFGFLYLIFCWTFIPALISLIEAIRYAIMSEEDFVAKYC